MTIFSGPMVRALLEGRKTMTRRLAWRECDGCKAVPFKHTHKTSWQKVQIEDRLLVRETIKLISCGPGKTVGIQYVADGDMGDIAFFKPDHHKMQLIRQTPAIYMPRWASRLTLIVTGWKIERLNDISRTDAVAEGIMQISRRERMDGYGLPEWDPRSCPFDPRHAFRQLWESLHGSGSWAANPELVAVTFEVHKANIDKLKLGDGATEAGHRVQRAAVAGQTASSRKTSRHLNR